MIKFSVKGWERQKWTSVIFEHMPFGPAVPRPDFGGLPLGVRKKLGFSDKLIKIEMRHRRIQRRQGRIYVIGYPLGKAELFRTPTGKARCDQITRQLRFNTRRTGGAGLLHSHLQDPSLRGLLDLENMAVERDRITLR